MNARAKRIILVVIVASLAILCFILLFLNDQLLNDQQGAENQQTSVVSSVASTSVNVDFGISELSDTKSTEMDTELKWPIDLSAEIGGQAVNFTLKPLELNEYFLPAGDGLDLYNQLSKKAQSDPIAARLLSNLLTACSSTHLNQAQHDDSITRLLESGEHPAANLKKPLIISSAESIELVRANFDRDFEQCKNLSQEKRNESKKWAKWAADGGDYLGLDLLAKAENISTADRLELYEKKWTDFGALNAAIDLSSILSGVGGHGSNSPFIGLEPDPPKAYAYFLASSGIEVAISEKFNRADTDQLRHELSIFEQLLSSKLTASEHLDAEKLARELIETNSNCCSIDPILAHEVSTNSEH